MNRKLLSAIFESAGFETGLAENGEQALAEIASRPPSVVLLDLRMPGLSGLETLGRIRSMAPHIPVIILTSYGDVPAAVEAIKMGAYDFIGRPINNDKLVLTVKRALEREHLVGQVQNLKRQLNAVGSLARFNMPSPAVQKVVEQIRQVSDSMLTVLIQGETGTGKELVARAIHQQSSRAAKSFVAIDCGAIPENLLESELFGYEKGAFSGADRRKGGHFQMAQGGSLFLDEAANLPPSLQPKLLRVMQERQVQPLGGSRSFPMDVRLIAATNDNLEKQVADGQFRQDLFYRLAEFTILLPALRDRREDILPLATRFLEEASIELKRTVCGLSDEASEALTRYAWPGNIRELRNVIRQAVIEAKGPMIDSEQVQPLLKKHPLEASRTTSISVPLGPSLKEVSDKAIAEAEKEAIVEALRTTRGNKTQAARLLKIDYKTLHVKIKRYGLQTAPTNGLAPD
jgi:DNA-binding NtrC family response regulator